MHSAARDDIGRYRLGWWLVVALLAAGCAASEPARQVATDQTDVWFMQHMVPYLRQTAAVVSLTRDHLTDPELVRLADAITRSAQADIGQLQGWLDQRGLAPHGHSHQRVDNRGQTDMERLSRLRGARLDQAFVRVMTARYRNGIKLAETEAATGSLPEVRRLARRLVVEQLARMRRMTSWQRALQPRAPAPGGGPAPTALGGDALHLRLLPAVHRTGPPGHGAPSMRHWRLATL